MVKDNQSNHTFKPVQNLGKPNVQAPLKDGFLSAAVQFIIPGIDVGEKEIQAFKGLSKCCGLSVYDSSFQVMHDNDDRNAALVTIAFYVAEDKCMDDVDSNQLVVKISRLLTERFIGILTFYAGAKCRAVEVQATIFSASGKFTKLLHPKSKVEEQRVEFVIPDNPFNGEIPSEHIFSALFWLRRGLAERDTLETFASLMVSLQSIAREVVQLPEEVKSCPDCGVEYERHAPGITTLVRHLIVDKLGTPKSLFKRLWRARCAIVAHGDKMVTADVFLELIDLKYDAAKLCFDGIKLAMNMESDKTPRLPQSFFISSALMYLD